VLWQYLEDPPGQSVPQVEWQQHFDGWLGFPVFQKRDLQVHRAPDELFAPHHEEFPEPGSGGMGHFPTPDGTSWTDIKIQFRNGHTVTIWAGDASGNRKHVVPERRVVFFQVVEAAGIEPYFENSLTY
jgi:hypothetical protein